LDSLPAPCSSPPLTGDSGSPLILTGDSPENDVVVGLVSWGLECAGALPGIYSRLSYTEIYYFIQKKVCNQSVEPPRHFDCDWPTQAPTFPPPTLNPTALVVQTTDATVDGVDLPTDSPTSTQLKEFFDASNTEQASNQNSSGANSIRGRPIRILLNSATGVAGILMMYLLI
jgi:hypothetical protein